MTDQNSQFFAILTAVGEAKQANADALGLAWKITQMGVGDANGTDPIPDRLQTDLINERRRAPLNKLGIDPDNAAIIVAEQVIPADVGGWWIREIGLYDEDGDLIAVGNCAPSYKPLLSQGSTRTQVVRMSLIVSSAATVQLKIDPSVVLATRQYVDTEYSKKVSREGDSMSGPLRADAGVRAKKGLPENDASNLGYSFETDGDTGLFADIGDTETTGSDLVLMVDGHELARFGDGGTVIPDASLPGTPSAPTAPPGTHSLQLANTAFVQETLSTALRWTIVPSGYVARAGDRITLNNRVDSPSVLLPEAPLFGDEIQLMPYPFTQYSRFPVTVDGNGKPIMGLSETMAINEDNVMCSCKFLGKLWGWVVEKMGHSGNSFTLDNYTARAYGPNAIQRFDARIVKGAPLVMMVHGGGWVSGDRAAANLANGAYIQRFPDQYGFGFASIDYTLADASNHSYPAAVNDVITAADYFKNTLGVTGIHILGTSAGANLAALAVIARPDLFSSFIGYYGAYDLTQLGEFSADVQADIGLFTTDPAAASPTRQAGAWSTPALLIHGDADTTVLPKQSADFGAAIGVNPIVVAGAAHAFPIFGDPAGTLPTHAKAVFNFIDQVTEK